MGVSFETILVANRGEIAVRVMRTARALGYRTVAVYTRADARSPHVAAADLAVCIGEGPVASSYLDPEQVLDALRRTGADAVHPGYGFLSENAAFARSVVDAGAVWIGPPPAAIEAMGDKAQAKARMEAAGVPCVPGFRGDAPDDAALIEAASDVGYPLLVKASAGGGGRGMRRVTEAAGLEAAIRSARAEAANAFGDDTLLLERLVEGARHVEVQVMADAHGAVLHLGERDCSVQRRHQKVIEEAPSPGVDADLRERMGTAACEAARAVGYAGAGTVEFLLGADGSFYFLEMNTRLQVEHPVTEAVTGLDLVELQLSIAAGRPLPFSQAEVVLQGHAIEARLYAEDPSQGYLPQPGEVLQWRPAEGIRVDAGLSETGTISSFYDPMVAKLIAHGPDRDTARRRLLRALDETVLFGVRSNRDLLVAVLRDPVFVEGAATTDYLEGRPELCEVPAVDEAVTAAALWLWRSGGDGYRNAHVYDQSFTVDLDGVRCEGAWTADGVRVAGVEHRIEDRPEGLLVDGILRRLQIHRSAAALRVRSGQTEHVVKAWTFGAAAAGVGDGRITMPMAGQVLAVDVTVGQAVEAGQVVAIVEAMKLETPLRSPTAGVVEEVAAEVGAALPTGALVVRVVPVEET